MKIALVHDYLLDYGGAEVVLWELHELFPEAPIYTILVDEEGMGDSWKKFQNLDIRTSWFNGLPFASKIISPLRFLLPLIWESFDLSHYDLVITSASWAVTKGLKRGKAKEICYLHTPPRYLYGFDTSRNWKDKWYGPLIKIYAFFVNKYLKNYDYNQAQKVDYFLANSENVGKRIREFYKRDYKVIYPPVDVEKIINTQVEKLREEYYLTGGRMTAAKNFGLIIKAFNKTKYNLKIFGDGIERNSLMKLANSNIEFLGSIKDNDKIKYIKNAKAFVVAQKDEDFGITPVEAMAGGCPVIAFKGGGYLETVTEGKTGFFFDELTVESLANKLKQFNGSNRYIIKAGDCIAQSRRFSKERFHKEVKEFVKKVVK